MTTSSNIQVTDVKHLPINTIATLLKQINATEEASMGLSASDTVAVVTMNDGQIAIISSYADDEFRRHVIIPASIANMVAARLLDAYTASNDFQEEEDPEECELIQNQYNQTGQILDYCSVTLEDGETILLDDLEEDADAEGANCSFCASLAESVALALIFSSRNLEQ